MIWTENDRYYLSTFEKEKDLEKAILEVQDALFGSRRIYLDMQKNIGKRGVLVRRPDGYLIDLTSRKQPKLYVVENELAVHHALRHIAVQILEFSLAFEISPRKVKEVVKQELRKRPTQWEKCRVYSEQNGFDNVDYLLEKMIYPPDSFSAVVIIDEEVEELESVLVKRFNFPVEIIILRRFKTKDNGILYQFEPFLDDIAQGLANGKNSNDEVKQLDVSEINTIVVPARRDGFEETFIGENMWRAIRIHSSMKSKIKFLATYQVAPISAITHVVPVKQIEVWKDTNKYALYFSDPPSEIKHIKLVKGGKVKAPQAPRYTSIERIRAAKNLDDAF